jgi:hypothetical protein
MVRGPVTTLEIQKWVARHHGFVPETEWIEHCKTLCGLQSPERLSADPCPPELQTAIKQAFRRLGMIQSSGDL